MNEVNQKIKIRLKEIKTKLNALDYNSSRSTEAYNALKAVLYEMIEAIPGYIENVRVLQTAKLCCRDIEAHSVFKSEHDFKFIKKLMIDNLENIKLYPGSDQI
jgi:hypothetical protein